MANLWRRGNPDRGYDAGKKIKERKRHVLVDTLGLILAVTITAASVQDRDSARDLLPWLRHHASRLRLEVVKRKEQQRRFAVLPKRWIVERTLGWLMKNRQLRCDCEQLTATSEA